MVTKFNTSYANVKTEISFLLGGHFSRAQGPPLNNSNMCIHAAVLMSILWIAGHADVQTDTKDAIFLGQLMTCWLLTATKDNMFIHTAELMGGCFSSAFA